MPSAFGAAGDKDRRKTIVFNSSKKELFTPVQGFKVLQRGLRGSYEIGINKEDITVERLDKVDLFVFGGSREKFTAGEFDAMKQYLDKGGSILMLLGEGGEDKFNTNVNYFLEQYNISVNNDAVARTVYLKYFHPKEALITNGVLNREINKAAGKRVHGNAQNKDEGTPSSLAFLYPYGATLQVQKPAIPILSTGSLSFPLNQPVCAFYHDKARGGKLAVVGSVHMFGDTYIEKEENLKLKDVIFQWLLTNTINLNALDAENPDISDYHFVPDTARLAERRRCCLQESEEVPKDFTKLFDQTLYKLDTSVIPDAVASYKTLNVKHEPLTLIQPNFETPLPPLTPAVFPPCWRELAPPALDLFDLDEHFSSERVRLAQITNKCNDDDLEYYVRECGEILGVSQKLPQECRDARHILEYIFAQVVEFKKLNQD
eukprot:Colp12_sorted_trinity150504_noHs@6361